MNLNELYSEVIMEHNRSGHNKHDVAGATSTVRGHNPNCGDDITIQIKVVNGKVEDAGYQGIGCAISQASASMMIDLIKGLTVEEAKEKTEVFLGMIKKEVSDEVAEEALEDAFLLSNISNMPARVKCAVLAWHALDEALVK